MTKTTMNKEYYLRFRNKYCPTNIKTVFILESPPASGKYFYDESGNVSEPLFKAMMKLLKFNPTKKKEGLRLFRDTGHFLVDATYKPVNKLKRKIRNDTILENYENLVKDIKNICDSKKINIILVKANVCRLLEIKLRYEGFNIRNKGVVIPFPSNGQQRNFCREMKKVYSNK